MEFSKKYNKYTREELIKKFDDYIVDYGQEFNSLLDARSRIQLYGVGNKYNGLSSALRIIKYNRKDATIEIEPNMVRQYLVYSGEFFTFLKNCYTMMIDNKAISYKKRKINLSTPFDNEMTSSSKEDDLDYSIVTQRINDFNTVLELTQKVYCVSADLECHNDAQKMAAVFTDCAIAGEMKKDFCSYSSALDICKKITNHAFASSLFSFASRVWVELSRKVYPYIDGTIWNNRIENGLCPNCGGAYYKGILGTRCVKCQAPKREFLYYSRIDEIIR